METLQESIYDHPKYYDLVFGSDCAAELKFILGCGKQFLKKPPTRFFEPACGTGRLIHSLAKKGFEVCGNDLNEKAVEFCNARFKRHKLKHRARVEDMANFKVTKRYDIGFNTINSFRHLNSEKLAKSHLLCMAEAIKVGGLYLLGVHLSPTTAEPTATESWSASRGHLTVNTHMWANSKNTKTRVEKFGIEFQIYSPTKFFRIEDELVLRSYTPKQMNRLIDSTGCWEAIAYYDFTYDLQSPIEVDNSTEDVVYVLKRLRKTN